MRRSKRSGSPLKKFMCLTLFAVIAAFAAVTAVNIYFPLRHTDAVIKYSIEYGLEPEFVLSVIHAESKFKEDAVSIKGASGLMQLTESTADWLAGEIGIPDFNTGKIFDPELNIRLGCYYLQRLKKQYGDINVALCAYNAGSGNVNKWLENPAYSINGKTLEHIPFGETREYVKRVNNNLKIYGYLLKRRGF